MTIGIRFAKLPSMEFFCRHCDEWVVDEPYRVISEQDGVILLNMTVCRSCSREARALGLHSEAVLGDLSRAEGAAYLFHE